MKMFSQLTNTYYKAIMSKTCWWVRANFKEKGMYILMGNTVYLIMEIMCACNQNYVTTYAIIPLVIYHTFFMNVN